MLSLALGLFLGFVSPTVAQNNSQTYTLSDFSGGLNTWQKGIYLKESESPNLLNVVLSKSGGVTKRKGYRKINTTAIGGGISDINSVYQFEKSNGTKYCVAFSSTTGYSSTDACQTFTAFVSTLTRNNDVNCDALQDRLYCVNNQYDFYFDGTNDIAISGAAADLEYIRVHRNRCFTAGNSTNPSRLYYSSAGDCNTNSTSTDYIDISPQDGDVIVGIGEPIYDLLPIYKKFSTWALRGATPETWTVINISKNTGAKNHRSIANFNNKQYFDSLGPNGGAPGIYAFNGIVINEESRKLRNEIDQLDTFKQNSGFKLIDSKSDYDSGAFDILAMSSSRDPGFMMSSYTTHTDTDANDWALGTISSVTTAISGQLHMRQVSTGTFINSGAESNSATINWSNNSWGASANTEMYGSYVWLLNSGLTCGNRFIMRVQDVDGNNLLYKETIINDGQGIGEYSIDTSTLAKAMVRLNVSWNCPVEYTTCSAGSTAISSNFITPELIRYKLRDSDSSSNCAPEWDLDESTKTLTAIYTSQVFDTAISTPIWGTFNVGLTSGAYASSSTGTITISVRVSTSSSGGFDSYIQPTFGAELSNAQKRYLQYKVNYEVAATTQIPPFITSIDFSAASTGTWRSPELFLSNNIAANGWGLFQAVQTTSGSEATITYDIRIATFAGGAAAVSPVSLTNGSAISYSTGAYAIITTTISVGVATETAKLDSMVINWSEGAQATSSSGKVFDDRYHYAAQSLNGSRNDVMYVLEENGAWLKWTGLSPRFLNVVNQQFIMGQSSTSSSGFIYKLYDTDADDGVPIYSLWESKDLPFDNIAKVHAIDRAYVIHSSSNTTLTVDLLANGGLSSSSYSIDLSTGATFGIKPIVNTPAPSGNTHRIRFSNNAASKPWEILGTIFYYRDLGLMP